MMLYDQNFDIDEKKQNLYNFKVIAQLEHDAKKKRNIKIGSKRKMHVLLKVAEEQKMYRDSQNKQRKLSYSKSLYQHQGERDIDSKNDSKNNDDIDSKNDGMYKLPKFITTLQQLNDKFVKDSELRKQNFNVSQRILQQQYINNLYKMQVMQNMRRLNRGQRIHVSKVQQIPTGKQVQTAIRIPRNQRNRFTSGKNVVEALPVTADANILPGLINGNKVERAICVDIKSVIPANIQIANARLMEQKTKKKKKRSPKKKKK